MNRRPSRSEFAALAAWGVIRFAGVGAAILLAQPSIGNGASPIPDAPTVAPAPMIDQPLSPVRENPAGEQPTPQHVWVPGHWRWHEGAYVWESGRWEIPPVPNVSWVPSQWRQQGNGYVLTEGYWDEVAAAPAAPQPPEVIVVAEPPPPPQREIIYERPTAAYVWIQGHWRWQAGRHVWIAGRWDIPPRPNVVWVPARWEARGGRYVFVEGYWRDFGVVVAAPPPGPPQQVVVAAPPSRQPVVVVMAPPPPRREVAYGRPGPGYVWIEGYWNWYAGRYVWMAGHWSVPPRGYRTWHAPRWQHRGRDYILIEGRWGR